MIMMKLNDKHHEIERKNKRKMKDNEELEERIAKK